MFFAAILLPKMGLRTRIVSINGNKVVTPNAIFYFSLPTSITPNVQFPSHSSFAAFAVKMMTSKPKVWK
jgi:hypothetical protein